MKNAVQQTTTDILNLMEKSAMLVWSPQEVARRLNGYNPSRKQVRHVHYCLLKLQEQNHLSRHRFYGSNQSCFWLKSRVTIPAFVDDIPF